MSIKWEYEQSVSHTTGDSTHREVGHRRNEGVHLGNRGNIPSEDGEYEQAKEYYVSA